MSNRDHYYNRAKQEGYRARSAYKLQQLAEQARRLVELLEFVGRPGAIALLLGPVVVVIAMAH